MNLKYAKPITHTAWEITAKKEDNGFWAIPSELKDFINPLNIPKEYTDLAYAVFLIFASYYEHDFSVECKETFMHISLDGGGRDHRVVYEDYTLVGNVFDVKQNRESVQHV